MKKIVVLFLAVSMMVTCVACGQQAKEEPINMEPKVSQMKAICELAVMECYYHNVAKYFEEDAVKGILGIGNKDKHFWTEYSDIVKLGIDISLVNIEVADTQITITIPEAKVLGCAVLATDVSGIRERLTHGETGWIVENSEDGIYTGLKYLLDHPELCEQLRSNAGMEKVLVAGEKYGKFQELIKG